MSSVTRRGFMSQGAVGAASLGFDAVGHRGNPWQNLPPLLTPSLPTHSAHRAPLPHRILSVIGESDARPSLTQ
jgi:hypothetical protein